MDKLMPEQMIYDYLEDNCLLSLDDSHISNISNDGINITYIEYSNCGNYKKAEGILVIDIMSWLYTNIYNLQ